jgi:hypothetical protein
MEYIILFENSHYAMQAYKKMEDSDLKAEVIPTPRNISAECGFAIIMKDISKDDIEEFCIQNYLMMPDIYIQQGEDYEKC